MSASIKKKLRKEQEAAAVTEKQLKAQADAKKLKVQTITFAVIMILVACIAIGTIAITSINRTGIFQKKVTAVTINNHELNSVDLGYYYVDAVSSMYNQWYNTYGDSTISLLQMMGLNLTQPLNTQVYDTNTGATWSDYFISMAIENARGTYAVYDAAIAEGFVMPAEDQSVIDENVALFQDYADLFANGDVNSYLESLYGPGAEIESYKNYANIIGTANAYQSTYYNGLTYDEADVQAHEAENYNNYTSYSFAYKFIGYNEYLHDGTEGEDHEESSHTADEIQAALEKAKLAAESVTAATSVVEFDELISKLDIYAVAEGETATVSTKSTDTLLTSVLEALREWLSADERKDGDTTVLPYTTETTNEDGTTTSEISGYFAVYYQSKNENLRPLANVRHLLVNFESATGASTYTDEEKAAAKAEAEALLATWNEGAKTEESFIELIKANSDDAAASEGSLCSDIHPKSNYVTSFQNWALDADRKTGDVEIIDSEYGYHIMYYVGDSEMTYREYMIRSTLRDNDYNTWISAIENSATAEVGNTRYMYHSYTPYSAY